MKSIKLFLEDIDNSGKRKEYLETLAKQKRERKEMKLRHQRELEVSLKKDFKDREERRLKKEREAANRGSYNK